MMNRILEWLLKLKWVQCLVRLIFSRASYLVPGKRVWETRNWMAIPHPKPVYPVHFLILSKSPYKSWLDFPISEKYINTELIDISQRLIKENKLEQSGYRLIVNGGDYQTFPILHFHLVSGIPIQKDKTISNKRTRERNTMNEVLKIIESRRSIRKFTDQPVDKATLTLLLKAAMAAPTAMNAQPWEFVVITEKEVIGQLRRNLMFGKMNASAVICVLGSKRVQKNKSGEKFWVQDCSAATQNILLAAASLGLGATWVGIYPVTIFQRAVTRILNLPDGVTPLNLIYLGYPAEEREPRTQYDEERVHWEPFPMSEPKTNINLIHKRGETLIDEENDDTGHSNI